MPASLQHLGGIEPGPPLELAAAVHAHVLVVHSGLAVAELLAAHYTGRGAS